MNDVKPIKCEERDGPSGCDEPAVARDVRTSAAWCLRHCCARMVKALHRVDPRAGGKRAAPAAEAQLELLP